MPIHDLGYRAWTGQYSSDLLRFIVIASTGIRVVGRNTWVRRMLLVAWLPTFGLAGIIFGYERLLENSAVTSAASDDFASVLKELGEGLEDGDVVVEALTKQDLQEGRHLMWSWLLSSFLRVPQAVMAMLVIGMIAPPLIARDVRTRAFLIYFSKPLGHLEYVFGKTLIIGTYLMFITTVPALGCYLFGVALSSNLGVLADTWDLPFRIVLASLIFIVPAVSVALMFSSLTAESRYAAFAWFAFWGLGFVAWKVTYGVMSGEARQTIYAQRVNQRPNQVQKWIEEAVERGLIKRDEIVAPPPPRGWEVTDEQRQAMERQHQRFDELLQKLNALGFAERDQRQLETQLAQAHEKIAKHPMSLVSMYDVLIRLQRWIFGLETQWAAILPSIVVTASVTLFAWLVLLRNVTAPIRV